MAKKINIDEKRGFDIVKYSRKNGETVVEHFATYETAREYMRKHPRTSIRYWEKEGE